MGPGIPDLVSFQVEIEEGCVGQQGLSEERRALAPERVVGKIEGCERVIGAEAGTDVLHAPATEHVLT